MKTSEIQDSIFAPGEKTSPDYFTGTALLNVLVPKDETGTFTIGNVVFEPGSRTNWHTHPAGQILLITSGTGFYQEKGKTARVITKGDVIVIPSQLEHWHGAASDSSFSHIAITNTTEAGAVKWLAPVTDEEYRNCLGHETRFI